MNALRTTIVVFFSIAVLAATAAAQTEPVPVDDGTPPPAAEEEAPASLTPTVSGFVNATYNYNFNHPDGGVTPFHTYTAPHHTFLLNNAHVALTGGDGHLSYDVEVDAGTDAFVNTLDDDFDVQEAYAAYVNDMGLGFKVGKFVTFNGIEVIESGSNPTISRGFLFGLAEPFTHVGGLVTYKFNDQVDAAVGVVNGWDVVVDNNSLKTLVAKLGFTTEQFLVTLSAYAGPEQPANNDDWRNTFDVTGVAKLGMIDLWFQANVGTEQGLAAGGDTATWTGAGVQPVFHVNDQLSIGARAEVFSDNDATRTGLDQTLFNLSVAPAFSVTKNLVMRAELRVDVSSEEPYVDTDGDAHSSQIIALGEALVMF